MGGRAEAWRGLEWDGLGCAGEQRAGLERNGFIFK